MKLLVLALASMTFVATAPAGPFDGKTFHGRIAYSSDGNHNDEDDWAASPVALAIFAKSGVKDKLVHFDYNSILNNTNPEWEKIHEASVLGAVERYGYKKSIFHDCRKNKDAAINSIVKAINESTAQNPLYFIIAGPMEIAYLAIQKSDPAKRRFVYCISHSRWNDGFAATYTYAYNKRAVIPSGINWVQIRDQNAFLSTGPFGRPSTEQEWAPWQWMRDSTDPHTRFLYERMKLTKRGDCSDAGMAYFLVSGDEESEIAKLRKLLETGAIPQPVDPRRQVRLEAENFLKLERFSLNDKTIRQVSHRLAARMTERGTGWIRTPFNQPYTAASARYDVEVRYFDAKSGRSRLALHVNGKRMGQQWESSADDDAWKSQTVSDVEVKTGDEIAVEVQGDGGEDAELDYVQFNLKASSAMLRLGIVQMEVEPALAANRDKIVRLIADAKSRGSRVAVFPESALRSEPGASMEDIAAARDRIRRAARESNIYVIYAGNTPDQPQGKPYNWMRVLDPQGTELLQYDKLYDRRVARVPGTFVIDGIRCGAIICADRWLRGVEELSVMRGAQITFELSDNFDTEWIDPLKWYWYVPRALRNNTWVVFANTSNGHGHSAVINPSGGMSAYAKGEKDRLVVVDIDPAQATRATFNERVSHPVLSRFWKAGSVFNDGGHAPFAKLEPYQSPEIELRVAAAQMACSRNSETNVKAIETMLREAAVNGADIVIFPELALTGAHPEDVRNTSDASLLNALNRVRNAAAASKVYAVIGSPHRERGKLRNSAFVIGPDGTVLTRYDQMAVEREGLFEPGTNSKAMWFRVKGVPSVVTIGRDALWNEIAEMTAQAGAQLHTHIAYDSTTGPAAALRRTQIWTTMASFKTFTPTVNAASPSGLDAPSVEADGGSAIWDDLNGLNDVRSFMKLRRVEADQPVELYSPWSANCVVKAGSARQIIYASRRMNRTNPHQVSRYNQKLIPWYQYGAALMSAGPKF